MKDKKQKKSFLKSLGPGLISGAADDDPSGIATYSVAGAKSGTQLLWLSILTYPLMFAVQMMCARIAMVTGEGLTKNLQKKLPRSVLLLFGAGLFIANTFNVSADLAAMGDAAEMVTGVHSGIFIILLAILISWATVKLKYAQISNILKWLCLFLFAYVFTAFILKPDWFAVMRETFTVRWPRSKELWSLIVAILGTTISPYLFFWQAALEIEEEKNDGRDTVEKRRGATAQEISERERDVAVGTFFSNLVMFFIILTTALTLHKSGVLNIETSKQAAEALKPIAGSVAALCYTLGILGTGFLAIPTLTGSAAYFFCALQKWEFGLDYEFSKARGFYGVIIASTVIAVGIDFMKFNPVKALFWSAIVNGVLAPFILVGVLIVAKDSKLMLQQPSSLLSLWTVRLTALLMFTAAGGLVYTSL